jgi:adenylate cyclase
MAEGSGEEKTSASVPVVFISYASPDAAVAGAVCGALEHAGIRCWLAPRDVMPGDFYADAIVHAIDGARAVVLVLSRHSAGSPHVLREVERASSKRHPVVSLRIDQAPLPAGLEYFLNSSQWLDSTASGVNAALPRLAQAVRRIVEPAPASEQARPEGAARPVSGLPSRAAYSRRKIWIQSRVVIVVTAVVAVGLAYVAANSVWTAKSSRGERPVAELALAARSVGLDASEKSVAVLPFVDLSEQKDQEYFAGGMADEILNLLAKIPELKVIARTSSFQFKGQGEDLHVVATKLGVAYVLEGSVRKSGDRVRVTAQLIDARTGAHRWSETFDRQFGDVLKMQDEIAAGVAVALSVALGAEDSAYPRELISPRAYDLYLRGLNAELRYDRTGFDEAIGYYRQAFELDPSFLPAAYALASAYAGQAAWSFVPPQVGFPRARNALKSALQLDAKPGGSADSRGRAHGLLAYIQVIFDWDWIGARDELRQALALAPHDAQVLNIGAELMATTGQWDEALRYSTLSLAQDPLNALSYEILGMTQYRSGQLPEAESSLRRLLELSPSYTSGHYYLACILLAQGRLEEALAELQQENPDGGRYEGLAIVYTALSRKADSDKALAQALAGDARLYAFSIAGAYSYRGELDAAVAWLDRAYQQKDAELYRLKAHPLFKKLEHDPRFQAFLRRMNLSEQPRYSIPAR